VCRPSYPAPNHARTNRHNVANPATVMRPGQIATPLAIHHLTAAAPAIPPDVDTSPVSPGRQDGDRHSLVPHSATAATVGTDLPRARADDCYYSGMDPHKGDSSRENVLGSLGHTNPHQRWFQLVVVPVRTQAPGRQVIVICRERIAPAISTRAASVPEPAVI
jgi:hypothetical protein